MEQALFDGAAKLRTRFIHALAMSILEPLPGGRCWNKVLCQSMALR